MIQRTPDRRQPARGPNHNPNLNQEVGIMAASSVIRRSNGVKMTRRSGPLDYRHIGNVRCRLGEVRAVIACATTALEERDDIADLDGPFDQVQALSVAMRLLEGIAAELDTMYDA